MSLRKHVKKLHTQFVTCERCQSDYIFSNSDYTFYKTKDAILKANGWIEFTDKPKTYLLCHNCAFSRKYYRLVFIIDNFLQIVISHHSLKEFADDHNANICELCLAIQRATFVTNDFQNYLKFRRTFFHTPNPPHKSSFDDSYDFSSDPDILSLLNSSPSLLDELEYLQDQLTNDHQDTTPIKLFDFASESPNSQTLDKDSLVDQILLIDKAQDSGSLLAEICDNAHDLPIKFNQNIPAQTTPKHNFSISKRVTFSNGALPIKLSYASPPLPLPPGASNSSSIFRYSLPIIFSLLAIILVCFFRL